MFTWSYYSYFKIARLSYHSTKISTSGFYNAMQLGEILTENREGINATSRIRRIELNCKVAEMSRKQSKWMNFTWDDTYPRIIKAEREHFIESAGGKYIKK